MAKQLRKKRSRRFWLVVCGLLLVALLVGLYVWSPVTGLRLAWHIEALREAGEPVALEELGALYPELPLDENAAPLYEKASALGKARFAARVPLDSQLPIQGPIDLPEATEPFPPQMLTDIRTYLASQKQRLALLHEAAGKAGCKFHIDRSAPGSRAYHERLAYLRDCARLLSLEATERAVSGQPDQAAAALDAALRMARGLRRDPWHTSEMMADACEAMALRQLQWVVARVEPSPQAARRLQERMAHQVDPDRLAKVLVAERCLVANNHQDVWVLLSPPGGRPGSLRGLLDRVRGMLGGPPRPGGPFAGLRLRPLSRGERLWCLGLLEPCIAAARAAEPSTALRVRQALADYVTERPKRGMGAQQFAARLAHLIQQTLAAEARLKCARSALAALRYRAKHGKLPETLDALVPDLVESLPPDPFSGKPLLYRKDADGFVLYAVGENGKDDQGDIERAKGKQPDIGFRVRLPKPEF